jgi:hydrogenase maturation factor
MVRINEEEATRTLELLRKMGEVQDEIKAMQKSEEDNS